MSSESCQPDNSVSGRLCRIEEKIDRDYKLKDNLKSFINAEIDCVKTQGIVNPSEERFNTGKYLLIWEN